MAVAKQPSHRRPSSPPARPTATAETALQRLARASPRAQALQARQDEAAASAASRQSAALQRRADAAMLQRQGLEEEEPLQGKRAPVQRQGLEEEELMQGRMAPVQRQPEEDEMMMKRAPVQRAKGQGALPADLQRGAETLAGVGLDDVRVTYGSDKPAQVGALAYAQGNDIHLAPGEERHLPHEAWHTVQQRQGRVRPTGDVAGVPLNEDPALEQEADRMGTRALAEGRRPTSSKD